MAATLDVLFGNRTPKVGTRREDGSTTYEILPDGHYTTLVRIPFDAENPDYTDAVLQTVSVMKLHLPEDAKPAWVGCENEKLRKRLADHYGIMEAAGWKSEN